MELVYLFPHKKAQLYTTEGNAVFISYPQKKTCCLEAEQVKFFEEILKKYHPDIIHIFGTEYPHSLAMIKAAVSTGQVGKVAVSIQGLVSVIAKHYYSGLPNSVIHGWTFRDAVKRNNIYLQKRDFQRRGEYEIQALQLTHNVIGRTTWDYACTKRCNSGVRYHFCNETLREAFYNNSWDFQNCEKHSVFVSQASYPIKGFHFMLEAMVDIVKHYPDAKLYTTGKSPFSSVLAERLRLTNYQKYIGKLIKEYGLQDKVCFLGNLDEQAMCERFCKAHVFVSCSMVENSPNSLGEAMILGVPVVASNVGGVSSMIENEKEGFLYQGDAPYMLAYYVMQLFENEDKARYFSNNAKVRARKNHDRLENYDALIQIYNELLG